MIRAVFFDFYSVWAPDKFSFYLANAQLSGPEVYKALYDLLERYYHGQTDVTTLAEAFRVRLGHPDITAEALMLSEASISPEIINFIRNLHGHFLKVGILANLGIQENQVLNSFNEHNQLFEAIVSPLSLQTSAPLFSQEVFAAALQAIGEPPESTLVISGNPYYLAIAATFGIITLQYEGLTKLETALNTLLTQTTT